ncbi:MAG TPA: hypothetical protein VF941_09690 [Clostridia bacterium]
MSDGYFKRIIHDQYKAILDDIVRDIYNDFKLYVDFGEGVFSDNLRANTKTNQIYDIDKSFTSDIRILVKESSLIGNSDTTENLKKIAQSMKEKNYWERYKYMWYTMTNLKVLL